MARVITMLHTVIRTILIAGFVYLSLLMIGITLQYVPVNSQVAFLALKTEEIQLPYYETAFFTHVYSSIFILILGFLQFVSFLRTRYPALHRAAGKLYVLLIILLSAPSGFIMGLHGNGGIYAQLSFCLQALLWFYFTGMAYRSILKGNIKQHYSYMVLSYALTLSALSLRLFKWIIVQSIALPPMDTYKIVVWLGWIFNVAVASIIIFRKNSITPI